MSGRAALLAAAAVAAAAVAVPVVLWAWGGEAEPAFRGSQPPPGLRLPAFALRDQDGRLVRSAALRGKVVLVTFLDTRCRDACPIIGEVLRQALERLRPGEAAALAISVHPGHDTPARVRAYLRRHRLGGRLRYLLGSETELRPVWKAFAVLPAFDTGDADLHSAPVRVYGPDGEWASTLHAGADLTPASLVHDVRAARRRA